MILKRHLTDLDPRATMGASLAVAATMLTPLAVLDAPSHAPTAGAVGAVIALGLVCTALAFVLMALLISEIGPGRAVVITYINPIIALALGVTLLGEQPGAGAGAGLLLILAGSWLSTDGRLPPGMIAFFARMHPDRSRPTPNSRPDRLGERRRHWCKEAAFPPMATHGTSESRTARSLIEASDLMPQAVTPARKP